jgi:hypothetical protein
MTLGDQLDGGYDIVRTRPRELLLAVAVFVVPLQLVVAFLNREALSDRSNLFDEALFHAGSADDGGGTPAGAVLGVGGTWLAHTLAAAAITFLVAGWYTGSRHGLGRALREVWHRAPALVAAWLLVHLLEVVAVIAPVLGSLVVMGLLLPTVPAMVVEDIGPLAGIRRAVRLSRSRLLHVIGVGVLSGALALLIGNALGLVPSLIGFALGPDTGWVFLGVGSVIADVVSIAVTAGTTVLVYLDLRIRHEGLDLAWAAADRLPT